MDSSSAASRSSWLRVGSIRPVRDLRRARDRVLVVAASSAEPELLLWRLDDGSEKPETIDLPGTEIRRFHVDPERLFLFDSLRLYVLDLSTASPRLLFELDPRRECHRLSGVAFDRARWFVATTEGCVLTGLR